VNRQHAQRVLDHLSGPSAPTMTRHDLRNAICCLHNIERSDLVDAGVIEAADGASWQRFASNPEQFFLRCGDEAAEALWGLIERQMQPRPVSAGIDRVMKP
jgi:hypothetical protein